MRIWQRLLKHVLRKDEMRNPIQNKEVVTATYTNLIDSAITFAHPKIPVAFSESSWKSAVNIVINYYLTN